MRKVVLFILVLLFYFVSCQKDNENFVTGAIKTKGGCFPDTWQIAIDYPNPAKHSFLRATTFL